MDFDTRLAAYAVVVDDGCLLLALWNEPDQPQWTLPGGGVDLDETPAEGAVRELREETGYEVELGDQLGIDVHVTPPHERTRDRSKPLKHVRVVYAARAVGGELRDEVGGSTCEARWVPLAEVEDLPRVHLVDIGLAMWHAAQA